MRPVGRCREGKKEAKFLTLPTLPKVELTQRGYRFYRCITNYHQRKDLTHNFLSRSFCRSEVWTQLSLLLCFRVSAGCKPGAGQCCRLIRGLTGERPASSAFSLLAEFISLDFKDWGHHFLAGYQQGATFSSYRPPSVLCYTALYLSPLTTW